VWFVPSKLIYFFKGSYGGTKFNNTFFRQPPAKRILTVAGPAVRYICHLAGWQDTASIGAMGLGFVFLLHS
jgi:hypothetical protein